MPSSPASAPRPLPLARLAQSFLLLFFLLTGSCTNSEPTLVIVVGGLGISQLGDLRNAITQQCPQATVLNAGGWDAYKTDIVALANAKPYGHIILIGHSFGCQTIARAADQLPNVDLAVFIDPAWDDFCLPKNVHRYFWFKRSSLGIERQAKILGASAPQTVPGDHNSIPHSPQLIDSIIFAINHPDSPTSPPTPNPSLANATH